MNACLILRHPVAFLTVLALATGTLQVVAQTEDTTSYVSTSVQQDSAVQADASQLGSLMRVPESAGLYIATMNHQAIIEAIFDSNAYKSIRSSDVAKGMKKAYRRGRTRGYGDYNEENPFAQYLKGYGDSIDNVVFQSVWQIAKQVVDNELFLYLDNDMLPVIASAQATQAKIFETFGFDGDLDFDELTEQQTSEMIRLVDEAINSIDCPTIMLGSRLENPQGFRGMLELARSAAEQGMRSLPEELDVVREFWKVVDEEDNFLLTADIDLSKLPWHDMLKEADNMKLALAIRDAVSKKRATVAMGVIDNLLIVGVAKDRNRLTEFGNGAKLVDLDSLKPLRKAIEQNNKLVSVFYMSDQYANASYSFEKLYEQLKPIIRPIINEIDEIPDDDKDELAAKIETEANEFLSDIGKVLPTRGMTFSYSSLHRDGLHCYSRTTSKHPMFDSSRPLNLVTHAGPNTIAFFNQRMYRLTDQYHLAAKWTSRLYGYARDLGMEQLAKEMDRGQANAEAIEETNRAIEAAASAAKSAIQDSLDNFNKELTDGEDRRSSVKDKFADAESDASDTEDEAFDDDEPDFETIKSFINEFESMANRFDVITSEKLLPAIDGQEAGLFVQAITGPNQWHPEIPWSEKPLALPLPAIVMGTRDAEAIIEAGGDYWKLAEDLIATAKEHFPDEDFDEIEMIAPDRSEDGNNTSFRWNFLADEGKLDPSLQTGALVSDNWIVMNFHPDQAKDLTMGQSDRDLFGPANTSDPSIGVIFYDHRVVMDSLRDWIDFAETQIPDDENPFDLAELYPAERDTLQFAEPQLRDAFERVWTFAKCFKGVSVRSYEESDYTVTECLIKFEDVAAE